MNASDFSGNYGAADKLIFFNFTTGEDAETATLEIKKGDTSVYTETLQLTGNTALAAKTRYTAYVDTMAAQGGNWTTADLQNAGTFSFSVKGSTSGTVFLSGSFTK